MTIVPRSPPALTCARFRPFVLGPLLGKTAMNNQQKIFSGLLALGFGFGCAGQNGDAKNPDPVVTKQKVGNISALDLAVCFPKAPALPDKINGPVLSGLLVASRPLVMECLVDPKNRGPAEASEFTLESSLSGGKLTHKFTGTNVTPDGEKCIGAAVDRFVATAADWSAKAAATTAPVTAKVPFQHSADKMPSVKMGTSEASDVAGTIRLAQGSFCDCYSAWKDAEPGVLKAGIKLKKGAATTVTFDASTDAAATQVAACLQPKVSALPFKSTSDELTAPYTFAFANSMGTGMYTNATPDMAFMQYDAMHNQSFGAVFVAAGGRQIAIEAYGALVEKYKKDTKSVTIAQLQTSCDGMLKGHDAYIAAFENQLSLEEKGIKILTDFAAKDASWTPVKDRAAEDAALSKKDVDKAKAERAEDAAICAKLKI
jgi:hypothetical protein